MDDAAEGHCALEASFEAAPCVVQVAVRLVSKARDVRKESPLDLSLKSFKFFKTYWDNFCPISPDELAGELRIEVAIRGVNLVLHTSTQSR